MSVTIEVKPSRNRKKKRSVLPYIIVFSLIFVLVVAASEGYIDIPGWPPWNGDNNSNGPDPDPPPPPPPPPNGDTYVFWMVSDMQVNEDGRLYDGKPNREWFQIAVDDANQLGFAAVCAPGDLINGYGDPDAEYGIYKQVRDSCKCKVWYEIAGNHEVDYEGDLSDFQNNIGDYQYTVTIGNILLIFMSDLNGAGSSGKGDFNWWKNLVINGQDKNIFVFTHHPLHGTTCDSTVAGGSLTDSASYSNILQQYHVDAWFSGHLHNTWGRTWAMEKWGTNFFDVGAVMHVADSSNLSYNVHTSSRVVYIDGAQVTVKFRDHDNHRFMNEWTYTFTLTYPFLN